MPRYAAPEIAALHEQCAACAYEKLTPEEQQAIDELCAGIVAPDGGRIGGLGDAGRLAVLAALGRVINARWPGYRAK